jgi:hypothetical protein
MPFAIARASFRIRAEGSSTGATILPPGNRRSQRTFLSHAGITPRPDGEEPMAENQQPSGQKKDQKDDEQRERGGPGSNPDQNRPDPAQNDEIRRNGSDSNR